MSEFEKYSPENTDQPVGSDPGTGDNKNQELDTHEEELGQELEKLEQEYFAAKQKVLAFDLFWIRNQQEPNYSHYRQHIDSSEYRRAILDDIAGSSEIGLQLKQEIIDSYTPDKQQSSAYYRPMESAGREMTAKIIDAADPKLLSGDAKEALKAYFSAKEYSPESGMLAKEAMGKVLGYQHSISPEGALGWDIYRNDSNAWMRTKTPQNMPSEYDLTHHHMAKDAEKRKSSVAEELENAEWKDVSAEEVPQPEVELPNTPAGEPEEAI